MLVLTVKDGEEVVIDQDIVVKVYIKGARVKLVFDAPDDVDIVRRAVLERVGRPKMD